MKKQKTSKLINESYEQNISNYDEDLDYDDYLRQKQETTYKESLESQNKPEKERLSEKKKRARSRIEITPEKAELARKNLSETPLEKNDIKAMIIAAFITLGLPTLIIMLILFGLGYLVFKLLGM